MLFTGKKKRRTLLQRTTMVRSSSLVGCKKLRGCFARVDLEVQKFIFITAKVVPKEFDKHFTQS